MAQYLIQLELKKKSIEFQMLVNAEALCGWGEKRGVAHYGRVGNAGETHKAIPDVTEYSLKLGLNSSAVGLYKSIITDHV